MSWTLKVQNAIRGLTQRWATPRIKQRLWDKEYGDGRWAHCYDTHTDPVYITIAEYARGRSILDLGCGSGNTGVELPSGSYRSYTGIDISTVALQQAIARSNEIGRGRINDYVHADILTYIPAYSYDVILLRESIYYVPRRKIAAMLARYERHLSDQGVFIVAVFDEDRYRDILTEIEALYDVVEERRRSSGAAVVVFQRKRSAPTPSPNDG